MKRPSFTLAAAVLWLTFAALAALPTAAQGKRIDKPAVAFHTNSGSGLTLTIDYLELSDTATTIGFAISWKPKWWIRIDSATKLYDEAGRSYRLLRAEGIELGKRFYMPDSGKHAYSLTFEPLRHGVKMFDCIEDDNKDNHWNFYGIAAEGTFPQDDLPEEWRHITHTADETLPGSFAAKARQEATVNIQVLGMSQRLAGFDIIDFYEDPTKKNLDYHTKTPIDNAGRATIARPLLYPTCLAFNIFGQGVVVIAAPGATTDVLIDLRRPNGQKLVGFKGDFARTCRELNGDTATLKSSILSNGMYFMETIRKGVKRMGISSHDSIRALLETTMAEMKTAIDRQPLTTASKQILKMRVEDEYVGWRTDFSNQLMFAEFYATVPREERQARFGDFMRAFPKESYPTAIAGSYPQLDCINSDYISYVVAYQNLRLPLPPRQDCRDLITTYRIVHEKTPWTDSLAASVNDENCRRAIAAFKRDQDSALATLRRGAYYNVYDAVAPEAILDTILAKHQGKAVLIDMWATWCGPCLMAMERMKPLKAQMAGKDIDFVYISPPSSPLQTWAGMIADIPGEHYYLTRQQWDHLQRLYKTTGVPTYALYNRQGRLAYTHIGVADNEKLRAEMEKAMAF